jgi:hypothetical protein
MLSGNPMFTFIAAWILACGVIFLASLVFPVPAPKRRALAVVVGIAAIARFVPLFIFREQTGLFITDINNYHTIAEAVLAREDAYVPVSYIVIHPYLPLQMYVFAAAEWATGPLNAPFFLLARIPHTLADVGIVALIYQAVVRRSGATSAFQHAFYYAICPFPLFVTVYHGQFDSISVFFALLSWLLVTGGGTGLPRAILAGLCLGVGILEKSWPIFLLPVLMVLFDDWRARIAYSASALGSVAAAVGVYLLAFSGSPSLLWERTARYTGPPFIDGHALVVRRIANEFPAAERAAWWDVNHGLAILLLGVGIALILHLPRREPIGGAVAVTVALLTSTTSGGNYHYLWLVPFAIIAGERLLLSVLLVTGFCRSMIVGFVGGGIYFGGLFHPELQTLSEHAWIIGVFEWVVLLSWYLRNTVRAWPRHAADLIAGYRRLLLVRR